MPGPLVVIIPHSLGKVEASRRLKSSLAGIRTAFGGKLSIVEEVWTEDHLEFRIGIFGQAATGTIDVADEHVRLAVQLPWVLAILAGKAKALIQKHGQLMLDKK
ncbi:Putative polyhydroxyalkanoic acid system protein (PHA_gran_rgn) [Rhizobiales bacterium GAS191]|nr:Putative polyhydroxyalkanoic acid system protein (PHA_gran_rgn) [Rhizobiales bacterium GAS191]